MPLPTETEAAPPLVCGQVSVEVFLPSKLPSSEGYLNSGVVPK